jgi:hypothetical protein
MSAFHLILMAPLSRFPTFRLTGVTSSGEARLGSFGARPLFKIDTRFGINFSVLWI